MKVAFAIGWMTMGVAQLGNPHKVGYKVVTSNIGNRVNA